MEIVYIFGEITSLKHEPITNVFAMLHQAVTIASRKSFVATWNDILYLSELTSWSLSFQLKRIVPHLSIMSAETTYYLHHIWWGKSQNIVANLQVSTSGKIGINKETSAKPRAKSWEVWLALYTNCRQHYFQYAMKL